MHRRHGIQYYLASHSKGNDIIMASKVLNLQQWIIFAVTEWQEADNNTFNTR